MENYHIALAQIVDAINPDGFSVRVGTGESDPKTGRKVMGLISADVAAFDPALFAWIIERGLACLHGEKLNSVPIDGGAKYREAQAMLAQANAGQMPQVFKSGVTLAKAGAIGDPVLAKAVDIWIAEQDAAIEKRAKSAKGRSKPNAQERRDYAKATAPWSQFCDAQGEWAVGKIADVLKDKPLRLEAARDALAAEEEAADAPVSLDDLF